MILVTLACFYFGMWEATKRQGVADVNEYLDGPNTRELNPLFLEGANASAPVPLIAVVDQVLSQDHSCRESPLSATDLRSWSANTPPCIQVTTSLLIFGEAWYERVVSRAVP